MPLFKKRSVVIQAIQLNPNYNSILKVSQFIEGKEDVNQNGSRFKDYCDSVINNGSVIIETNKGLGRLYMTNWLVKGEQGCFYTIKNKHFLETYEEITEKL